MFTLFLKPQMWNEKNKYITVHFRFAICCQGLSEAEAVLEAAAKVIEDSKCKTILEFKEFSRIGGLTQQSLDTLQ